MKSGQLNAEWIYSVIVYGLPYWFSMNCRPDALVVEPCCCNFITLKIKPTKHGN
jgi:hypothetical protein